MRILITGGAGFVGSHLSDLLIPQGHQVVVVDNLSSGSMENISHLLGKPNFKFVDGRAEGQLIEQHVEMADMVFHLAATVGVFNVIDSPAETIENNVEATLAVLRAAKKTRTKVILASTSEVYGKTTSLPFHEDGDVVLGPTTKSRWSYAASKMVDEFLALAYWQEHQVPVIVVRIFNTIGPRQVGRYGMVVPRFLGQALRNENITIYGTGQQTRCFTYVSDVTQWLWLLANNDQAIGQVFNLGNPNEISIEALARKVIEITGAEVGTEYVPYQTAYDKGFEEMQRRIPDVQKAIALTGFSPQISLDESLRRTRDWLIQSDSMRNESIDERQVKPYLGWA